LARSGSSTGCMRYAAPHPGSGQWTLLVAAQSTQVMWPQGVTKGWPVKAAHTWSRGWVKGGVRVRVRVRVKVGPGTQLAS
jgi:hypothetical protein